MRKLTGFFAVLLLVLTVSPVMASSTSDSATNDYTATVSEDMRIDLIDDRTTVTAGDGVSNATYNSGGSYGVSFEINPTATSDVDRDDTDEATVEVDKHYEVSTNVDSHIEVNASGVSGEFGDGNSNATGKPLSDLVVYKSERPVEPIQLNNDSTTFQDATRTLFAQEDTRDGWRYRLNAPDDMDPGTYKASMTWKIVAGSSSLSP